MNVTIAERPKDVNRLLREQTIGPIVSHDEAQAAYNEVRRENGLSHKGRIQILSDNGAIEKQTKGQVLLKAAGIRAQLGLSLAPASMSGLAQVCRWRTPGCEAGCLHSAGNGGRYDSVKNARIVRTLFLMQCPREFISLVLHELHRAVDKYAPRRGIVVLRPNVLSDILWELYAQQWYSVPRLKVHDYTKFWNREPSWNYHLTYSANERRGEQDIRAKIGSGQNVAMVLALRKKDPMPTEWRGMPVIDGDVHDARILDPSGVIVALRPKGSLALDSPFVFPTL